MDDYYCITRSLTETNIFMKHKKFLHYTHTLNNVVTNQAIADLVQSSGLLEHIKELLTVRSQQYETPYASLALPDDRALFLQVETLAQEKKLLKPTLVLVIGIGGSSLGAKAIYQALVGSFAHFNCQQPQLYFLETVDQNYTAALQKVVETALAQGENVIVNVITKSGTTTETLVNFETILTVLKKYRPADYYELVVVISDNNSSLHKQAKQENFSFLSIPKQVGGRYSVFSAVGLFPLMMVDIDCNALLAGASDILKNSLSTDLKVNQSAQSALMLYLYYQQGYRVHDSFFFAVDLEGLGKWYRQLMAESIGKEYDVNGKRVCRDMLPTVSVGTGDLHSVAQLYLNGQKNIVTTFVSVEDIQKKSEYMHAFIEGTKLAYQKNGIPFSSLIVPSLDAYGIGQFMQCKMVEIIILGFLFQVNPFDQPNVELYKKEVKCLLIK